MIPSILPVGLPSLRLRCWPCWVHLTLARANIQSHCQLLDFLSLVLFSRVTLGELLNFSESISSSAKWGNKTFFEESWQWLEIYKRLGGRRHARCPLEDPHAPRQLWMPGTIFFPLSPYEQDPNGSTCSWLTMLSLVPCLFPFIFISPSTTLIQTLPPVIWNMAVILLLENKEA